MRILFFFLLILTTLADCPINLYPRQSVAGYVQALLNNDINLHNSPKEYIYPLNDQFQEGSLNVATGLIGLELNSRGVVDFSVQYMPNTILKSLRFSISVNDQQPSWRYIKFNFFATQSKYFSVDTLTVNQFSGGYSQGKYSIFTPILNLKASQNPLQIQPVVKVFLSGIKLLASNLDGEYNLILGKFQNLKKFSNNPRLVQYFAQAIQIKKSLSFRFVSSKLSGRMLLIHFQGSQIKSLRFSYVVFYPNQVNEKVLYISGDFYLQNNKQQSITPLKNMGMMLVGLTELKISRDQLYSSSLTFNYYMGQASFKAETNIPYFGIAYTYVAFETKNQYYCQNCPSSPIVFQQKLCVTECPRGYSQTKTQQNTYCDKCQVSKLKVVDVNTQSCVCAKRHYLDQKEDICKPCSYDCMTCDSFQCLTCDNNLFQTKRRINQVGRCVCPIVGFFDDKKSENIVCQKCSPKCVTCNGPRDFDCLTCSSLKQLDFRGFCVCKNGFVEDSSGNCVCLPPRLLLNNICIDNQNCGSNQVQQYVDISRRCICRSGFQQVLNNCIKCGINSIFNAQQLSCKCINNTVMINNQCVPCPFNMQYDQFQGICVCKQGTFKANDGVCIKCPIKMAYMNGRCQCIYNYYETQPNICQRCTRESDGPRCKRTIN